MQPTRVFWLGAHKVLKFTELRDLRAMGLEVFNPPYITSVYDQSADLRIDFDQPTTLPPEVFQQLISYNFFYNRISEEIAELLNEYFDMVVVTLNADWLKALLAAFNGKVVYRVYGQHSPLSDTLIYNGMWRTLIERPDFSIMPFCSESIDNEHRWFVNLCKFVVPYQIPDDVFSRTGLWTSSPHRREIATGIPNIQNAYFKAAYEEFNARFPHRLFRIYGPQRETPRDSRIVGSLQREVLLDRFASSAGFYYDFKDSVCYLPPVEMMELGGPVIYAPGSLLSRMYDGPTPGLARGTDDVEIKLRRLLTGDAGFVNEVVAAQECVRKRYDRAIVQPLFRQAFEALLRKEQSDPIHSVANIKMRRDDSATTIVILLHVDGLFTHRNGRVYAFEGIPRVVDIIADALCGLGGSRLLITCTTGAEPAIHDFFQSQIALGQLRLMPIDCGHDQSEVDGYENRLRAVRTLNHDNSVVCTFIPHYYLFPEALLLKASIVLYLPDFFPHIMPGVVFDRSAEKDAENKRVGVAIAKRATAILTNSSYTASYLSDAGFADPFDTKIKVAPLPLLGAKRVVKLTDDERLSLKSKLAGRRYLLYPTANRPNKQMAFLLRVLAVMRLKEPDLMLVTTCSLGSVPIVLETFNRLELENDVLLLPGVDEGSLQWLYENSAALCLTSTLEGNFPPQVREALEYGTPVVATRLSPILEALGDAADDLLLCDPLDLHDFISKLTIALSERAVVIDRQQKIVQKLHQSDSGRYFNETLSAIVQPLEQQASRAKSLPELV